MARIGINGFGRIGRYLVRLMAERNEFPVVINARADNASLAHLFKYDSVHHTFKGTVGHDENGIIINGTHIAVTRCKPNEWQWKDYGVDLVVESTGTIKKRAGLAEHMACGAKKVIMSAPVSDADITIVMGVNDGLYDPAKHDVVSSASCTTNCLAPVAKVLNDTFGIEHGLMTTIHSYTMSQRILDGSQKDIRRARAAAMSMIPTTTGAAKAVALVLPELKGKLDEARGEEERATRDGDLARASELRYAVIPGLEHDMQAAEAELDEQKERGGGLNEQVTSDEIAEVVSAWTGVPVSKMMQGELEKLSHLEEELHKRVIGQDEAVRAVSAAVRRSRAGLSDPDQPIGSFFFLGPTGVGKTELAKALAECLFDDERALVRIDMSEYMEKFSVQRLIGAPPGYVGYDEGGQLTEAVRRRPYSVILLDEMEKAHPDVFNVLLQVLDDGRLTDGQGRQVSFKNTIIIMTSNVGSQAIAEHAGTDDEALKREVDEAMRATFRPEFLNRIDDIVVFHPLGMEQIEQIVDIQLAHVRERLAKQRMALAVTPAAKQMLAMGGLDPVYGARPLKRLIQNEVVDCIARAIIDGMVHEGDQVTIDVDADNSFYVVAGEAGPAATYEVPAE